METQIDLVPQHPKVRRNKEWIISILSSALLVGSWVAGHGNLAEIKGLDAVNLANLSKAGSLWFYGFLAVAAMCLPPMLRNVQIALGSMAYGMMIYILVDLGSQLREFQAMGIISDQLMSQVNVGWPGLLMAVTMTGFLSLILIEAFMRVMGCRK